jgi:hypothetical protein
MPFSCICKQLLPVVLNGVSSFSTIGIFLIIGTDIGAIIRRVTLQFITDLFK